MGLISGLILAVVFPLLFLRIIYKSDFYQIGQFPIIVKSLVYGVFAYLLASLANTGLEFSGIVDPDIIKRFIAPVLEEILKGLALLYLIRLARFTFFVDGALYGFATGIGFAVFENLEYVRDASTAITDALERIFSANLVHASGSAIIGIALGTVIIRRNWMRWLILAFGLFLAIGQHMFYNIINDGTSLVIAFGIGIVGTVFVYIVMQHGKKQAQDWIRQKLGMDERITPGEVALVDRLPSTDNLLLPVLQRFGAEKAGQVEKLLYLQARLGIKRKTLESIQGNTPMRKAAEAEIRELRKEIKAGQRAIGAYTMLFVRGLFTEEMVSVWDRMQAKIRERFAVTGCQKGGGLWSTLEERVKPPTDTERLEERLWNKIPPNN